MNVFVMNNSFDTMKAISVNVILYFDLDAVFGSGDFDILLFFVITAHHFSKCRILSIILLKAIKRLFLLSFLQREHCSRKTLVTTTKQTEPRLLLKNISECIHALNY
jgi:hypothetical protein